MHTLFRFLTVRPAFTLAGLRLLWLAFLVNDTEQYVSDLAGTLKSAGDVPIDAVLLMLANSLPYPILRLALIRIVLEAAAVILVGAKAGPSPSSTVVRALTHLVVLNPVLTRRGLWVTWIAALAVWALGYVANVAFVLENWAEFVRGGRELRAVFGAFVQPILLILLVRVAIEVAAKVLPQGAEPRRAPRKINVLLIGSGGREHALAWKLRQSPNLAKLHAAPGNPGIAECAELAAIDVADSLAVIDFCRAERIDLVVVGPEAPLVAGLVDDLAAAGIRAFGPTKAAAQLEGSKGFTKDLSAEAGIPTAAYRRFADAASAKAYVGERPVPIVIKADGLAAGKGVTVAATREAAIAAIEACFAGAFGAAGAEVVVEEFLTGEEASFFVLSDGTDVLPLATAQDHKRAGDGDTGPNTGGMGAYSPAPIMTPALTTRTMDEIIRPTIATMRLRGTPFRGVLYAGLMITAEGPKLIEYNVRFGDPEAQALMLRLDSDLLELLYATANGRLGEVSPRWSDEAALTVVMAAKGYPGDYRKGGPIGGIDRAEALEGVKVFQAGTARRDDGTLVASGGRVLNVTARGPTIEAARARAYEAVARIDFPGGFCRSDIGGRAPARS